MRIAVVGASGFVGSAALRAAAERADLQVVAIARRPAPTTAGNVALRTTSLQDRHGLRAALRGVDAVLCCVSYTGSDPALCEEVNTDCIRLLAEAVLLREQIPRMLHIGTTAIYGTGPHRGLTTSHATVRPESEVSLTRAVGDGLVRSLGGSVLRPHLVFGAGDRWCAPTVATITTALGAYIDQGSARLSTIDVDTLAEHALDLLTAPSWTNGAAIHPAMTTRTVAQIIDDLHRAGLVTTPQRTITLEAARDAARLHGIRKRHIDMLGLDHWYA